MATVKQALLARLGAARIVLQQHVGTGRHATISRVQKAAVEELIQDALASQRWSSVEVAHVTDRVLEVN